VRTRRWGAHHLPAADARDAHGSSQRGELLLPALAPALPAPAIADVTDLLAGNKLDCPPLSQVNRTMPKARRYQRASEAEQRPLTRAGMVAVK
jgi:hypothetical protein